MSRTATILLLAALSLSGYIGCSRGDNMGKLKAINEKFMEERFDEAIVEYQEYLRTYPNSAQGWSLLGWAYTRSDSLIPAVECFDRALAIDPGFDNAYVGKGVVYRASGDLEKARASYVAAIEIEPENKEAFSSLAMIEIMEENYQQAVEYGEKAWNMDREDPAVTANLALAYHYNGQIAQRDSCIDRAEKLGYRKVAELKELLVEDQEPPEQP